MVESTISVSASELAIMALALKQLEQKDMQQRDKDSLRLLEYKLTITHKGQKYRLMLVEE